MVTMTGARSRSLSQSGLHISLVGIVGFSLGSLQALVAPNLNLRLYGNRSHEGEAVALDSFLTST